MNVLFVTLNPGHVGHYDGPLRLLIDGGHRVVIAYQTTRNKDGIEQVHGERLQREYPDAVEIVAAPEREDGWADLVAVVRQAQDYLRYFRPEFRRADALRERARRLTPPLVRALVRAIASLGPFAVRAGERVCSSIDRSIPESATITAFLRDSGADVLLVTPLVDTNSTTQVDFVRAARRLGVQSGHCVASWDNLTNKGSMRVVPDRVFVWNEAQKREAVALHRVPPSHVVITGAQIFDRWFDMRPTRTREEFCRRVGLPADRPFILYLGSSLFIAPQEGAFVERWIRAIRNASDPDVSNAGILIRPHPNNATHFMANDFSVFGDVVVWPPFGADRLDPLHDADYFESLCYCTAAVGVNTSAMIEAAIAGRPVHTVLVPDFQQAQEGTLHFEHLTQVGGGLLHVAHSFDEHVCRLHDSLATGGDAELRSAAFVAEFVRPLGITQPAAAQLARAIESMRDLRGDAVAGDSLRDRSIRLLLSPLAALASTSSAGEDRPWWVSLVRAAVAMWVVAVRVRFAVVESSAWEAARYGFRQSRSVVRHVGKDLAGAVRQSPRRVHRAWARVWEPLARRVRGTEHTITLARKRLRRSARVSLKRVRRGTRSAADVIRVPLAALRRR